MHVHANLRTVGRYEILEIIGVGANGRVARAFDPLIARIVAIKLFPAELARGEARNRFVQEARVVGQISHPAIIALHDMGIGEPRFQGHATPRLACLLVPRADRGQAARLPFGYFLPRRGHV